MMNKSLPAGGEESSGKAFYGFRLLVIPGRATPARTPDTVHGAGFRVRAKTRVPE
jgi:hypothetical protein